MKWTDILEASQQCINFALREVRNGLSEGNMRKVGDALRTLDATIIEQEKIMTKSADQLDLENAFPGFPQIVLGWPDAVCGSTFEEYIEDCKGWLDDVTEETLPIDLPDFEVWQEDVRAIASDLGFSYLPCDLCGSPLGGDRYAATALPENPAENPDYVALCVCGDCLMYVANGEVPE